MAKFLGKLNVLIWKSYIVRKRHWIVTLLELCVPFALFIGLAILNSFLTKNVKSENEQIYPKQDQEYIMRHLNNTDKFYVMYTPVNNVTDKLMHMLKTELSNTEIKDVHGMKSETDMELVFKQLTQNGTHISVLGIVFLEDMMKTPLKTLNYKIRSDFRNTDLFVGLFGGATADSYVDKSILALQMKLDRCFFKFIGRELKASFSVQKFPRPAMKGSDAKLIAQQLLSLTTVLSFIFLCPAVLKRIVEEKQSGVKELMKLMGLPSLLLWLSWFIHAMSIAVISITIITIIVGIPFSGGEPLLLCSGIVVWIFLLFYCIASVTFLFAVSALFRKPTLAMVFGLLVWIGTGIATRFIDNSHISSCCKILTSLLPNMALSWGFQAIFHYENRDVSMSFVDVFNPVSVMNDSFHLWQVWVTLVVQSVLYVLIALYLEAIFPGDYGVAKPWYFPVMDCFKWMRVAPQSDMKGSTCHDAETFEPLAESLPIGIKIRKLFKVFKSVWSRDSKTAVDGVSLDICKEQITALLGHNGAGKSTTMMILTGMLSPTSGTVEINGYDIKYHMNKVRESLGLCPQHNLLFPDLTVQEHLLFFAKLKGGPDQDPEAEVAMYARKLNLVPHLNKTPQQLSGGYKRRLCLALAFIGQSKTIILDEPTSGLDPEARREIWDLLLSMRGSRTILITTHIMEEADVLGDRIAIMDHGQVQCYGTPMYLKKLYGTGYVLSILKNSGDAERIETAVKGIIPEAELKSCVASLVTFNLPDEKRSSFPELFALLQRERIPLGVESVGVSITTLEEVFLRVGEIALEEEGKNEDVNSEVSDKSESTMNPLSPHSVKGFSLFLQQLKALFKKRALVMNCSYLIHLVLLVLVTILVTVVALHAFGGNPMPSVKLDLSLYGKTNVMYSRPDGLPEEFVGSYVTIVTDSGSKTERLSEDQNITSALLKRGNEDKQTYIFNYVVAAAIGQPNVEQTALYSDMALHSLPISVNLLTNALLNYETRDSSGYSISVTNHPFQRDEPEFLVDELVTLVWMALVPLALTFWMGLFVILPMQERVSSSRQLQCMTGVKVPTYWFTLFLWDFGLHILMSLILILTIYFVDGLGVFNDPSVLGTLLFILILYGLSAIPFSYLVSFWKDTWAGCYSILVIINIVTGLILVMIMQILHDVVDVKAADGLESVVRLVPNFAFTQVIFQFVSQVMQEKTCLRMTDSHLKQQCSLNDAYKDFHFMVPEKFDKCCSCVGKDCYTSGRSYMKENQNLLVYLGLSWILYMFLVIIIDMGFMEWLWEKVLALQGHSGTPESSGNDDVDGEAKQVQKIFETDAGTGTSADLLVNNLKKKYGILPKPLAVKGVSFHVKPGECFGLLGVNGAGKTTTFKMLTGATVPTHGVAAIAGYRSDTHTSQYLSQIGYCPQHDALIECLTATEKLKLYGTLRGVPSDKLDHEVQRWIHLMGLREYRNRKCGTYSGGNKRKLMTAMALIGSPPLVFLDEPTSGVDPVARRNLWNSLISLQKMGQSIVLTSHSMEECEALCNRLGIMVDGQLMCMGNIPYLKNKYKQGSTIKIKLSAGGGESAVGDVKEKMKEAYSELILKDEHETLLHYHITNPNVSWGYMFETMEGLKEKCDILEDYTISETTLEEVFLSFAQTECDV